MIGNTFLRVMLDDIKEYITEKEPSRYNLTNALLHIDYLPTYICWRLSVVIPNLKTGDIVFNEYSDIYDIEKVHKDEKKELVKVLAEGIIKQLVVTD